MVAAGDRGHPTDDVLAELDALATADVRWRSGRAFSLAYHAGPDIERLHREAYARFGGANALNTDAFPSLRRMQAEVVDTAVRWTHGAPEAVGSMTSGGTESILLAVKAARDRARAERGVTQPNMVLATTAHAAFEKASAYFGVESIRVPVDHAWRADPASMAAAVTEDTVLIVASAPQYPQGVLDPVPAIAAIASANDLNCHVDACMGGVMLPALERLGRPIDPWDFRVEGVSSISVDLHKFGYTAKGASVLAWQDRQRRRYQFFTTDNWLGGTYGSAGLLGTKSGGPIAAAWAVLRHLGDEGYERLAIAATTAFDRLREAIEHIDGLRILGEPATTLCAIGVDNGIDSGIDAHERGTGAATIDLTAVATELARRGWYVDVQGPPPSLHLTVNAVHEPVMAEFVADLTGAVAMARGRSTTPGGGTYATVE